MDKTQADLDLYFLTRNVQWRYRLDQYEDATIAEMLKTVRSAVAEIKREIFDGDVPENADELVAELEALSAGLRERVSEDVATMSSVAGEYSVAEHTAIMSLDGAVKINTVALSAAQFKEFLGGPTQGTPLPAWVNAAWGEAVSQKIKRNLNVAVLRGEGYQKAVRGLLDAGLADFTEREAVTIARTYVQTANVAAQMAVYQENDDLVTGWKWSAVLEPGYAKSGRGTCLRCQSLDQREFKLGEGPSIPLHPRCRCVALPVLKTWRELGIDRDELEPAIRPYTIRPDANIDAGGMRTIIESGRHQGDYASWFEKQTEAFKINAVGPGRYELLKSGKIDFADLVDDMGNSRTIAQLKGLKGGVGGVGGVNFVNGVAVREQIESAAYKIMEEIKDGQADNTYIERFMKAHGLTLDDYKNVNDSLYKHNISSGTESDTLLSGVWNSTGPDGKAMRVMSRWQEWQAEYEASRPWDELQEEFDRREIAKNILETIKKQGITEGESYRKFAKHRTFGHVCPTLERAEKYLNAVVNGEPVVFRKGGLDHAALSTTKSISGATSGTSKFVPDRFFTLSELADEGYYPVSGYRGLVGLTSGAEQEVIFLKPLPASSTRVSPTMTMAEAETWAANSKIKETLYHGTQNKSEILKGGFSLDVPVKNGRINGDGVYFAHQIEDAQGWGSDVVRVKVNATNPATYDEINKGTALPDSFRGVEMDSKYAKKGGVYSNWDWIEEVGKEYFPDDIRSVRMAKVFKEIGIDAIIDPRTHAGTVVFDVSKIKIIKD